MVGIVIVSHSATLAEGVRELAEQMVQGKVAIATAGGIDDPENPIGTDAMKVLEAIQAVYSEDGVVVLMDLGSALLSAEMALEFLDPEQLANVRLTAAPLVEGTMAAAVQASIGGTADQVVTEAQGALGMKASQLGEAVPESGLNPAPGVPFIGGEAQRLFLTIPNRLGLHARPAALFVTTAGRFDCAVQVMKGDKFADAKSINQVAMLGARQGDEIEIVASGVDAAAALAALEALAEDNFGDVDEDETLTTVTAVAPMRGERFLGGIAASPGIAIGPVAHYRPQLPEVVEQAVSDSSGEWARLQGAIDEALREIALLKAQAARQVGEAEAAIFEAHALFLRDPALLDAARESILSRQINAEAAWEREINAMAEGYRALEDTYMQARAADIEDAGNRVLRQLLAVEAPTFDFAEPSILLAADLSPSDTARLEPELVIGVCTELGGATSHSAILARALGIPAIVGVGQRLWSLQDGQQIAMDGATGRIWPNPDQAQLQMLLEERDTWIREQEEARQTAQDPAITQDGRMIAIAANIGGPKDVQVALGYGAEGVGLFRTEFLFLDRDTAPSEEEQVESYRAVADELGQRPLIIRTLDVGGDKPLPYLDLGPEENPFLGWRGIRFCLDRPDVFLPQLRAILRAGYERDVQMMFPMIGSLAEIRAAKEMVGRARDSLEQDGLPFSADMPLGIMIEVPSAVAIADQLAKEVDFFSIGTNDLTQYTMAADRGNTKVAGLAQALHPAILRLIRQTAAAAHEAGIWAGMCGELAGNALAAPILVGLGLDELSMSAPAIPAVKEAIRCLSMEEARRVAETAMRLESATAVTDYLTRRRG